MKFKYIICILIFSFLTGMPRNIAYCEEFYGWVKKENVSAPCNYFPIPTYVFEDGFIYSQPNTMEAYRIGYGQYMDPITALDKEMINDEKWIHIQFPEWLLLKNNNMKSKLIVGQNKFLAQGVGMIIGAMIGYSIATNVITPSVNNNMFEGWPYLIIGTALGFLGGSILPEIYNQRIIEDYKKKNEKY